MSLLDEILASTRDLVAAQKRERSLESIRADLVIRTRHAPVLDVACMGQIAGDR